MAKAGINTPRIRLAKLSPSSPIFPLAEIQMHQSFQIKLGHPPDFRVSYRFYDQSEGGRQTIPFQGYRSDFWYFHPDQTNPYSIYMIWPEFEDTTSNIILSVDSPIARKGTASMWIIDPKMRQVHRDKIKVGLSGYFMEASRRVAKCTVIEMVGLLSNPSNDI